MTVVRMPGDKSISHRALILASLADGPSRLFDVPDSGDVGSTRTALRALGVELSVEAGNQMTLHAPTRWVQDDVRIDCGNSGTTARLLAGLMTGLGSAGIIGGDGSLERRPMDRVVYPLQSMGGRIEYAVERDRLPIRIGARTTGALRILRYRGRVASAQVKSALLLAGLASRTEVEVREPRQTRDHTERMLGALGAPIGFATLDDGGARVFLSPEVEKWCLPGFDLTVPGDISSAAFLLAAGILSERSVRIEGVGLNPTRTAFLDVMREMGAEIRKEFTDERLAEPVGNLILTPGLLKGVEIDSTLVPSLIDELPVLSVLAAQAEGTTRVTGAEELRHKESDRIAAIVSNLQSLGIDAKQSGDGFLIHGTRRPLSGLVRSYGDHRIAMAFALLGRVPGSDVTIDDLSCARVSYPGFLSDLEKVAPGVGK
jgi:3-phosphoshikimate 1-carboxyvinyltransferase